jgi:hypothetical protein
MNNTDHDPLETRLEWLMQEIQKLDLVNLTTP